MRSRRLKVSLFSNIKFWVNFFALCYTFNVFRHRGLSVWHHQKYFRECYKLNIES